MLRRKFVLAVSLALVLMMAGSMAVALALTPERQPIPYTEEESRRVAEEFLRRSPTFRYDGVAGSIELISVDTLRCPFCWEFTFRYQTANAGHGDRSGAIVLPVVTNHVAKIVVNRGQVARALCDGTWDMLAQRYIN